MRKIIIVSALFVSALAAYAKDIQKVVLTTEPQMHCQKCETRIKNQLKFEKGIKKIETSVEKQTVTITYDADKTDEETLMKSLKKINYNSRVVKDGEKIEKEGGACPMK